MKGTYALVIAVTLGFAAAAFNFLYLQMRSQSEGQIVLLGIKKDVVIRAGSRISEADVEQVPIPEQQFGNLDGVVFLHKSREEAYAHPVCRELTGPSLVFYRDVRPPGETFALGPDEAAIGIPVDTRSYPMSLVVPGDKVSFVLHKIQLRSPTPTAMPEDAGELEPIADQPEAVRQPLAPGPTETLGPFTVLSLGNRLGSTEVMRANRIPQSQGNVITIRVKVKPAPSYELIDPRAQKLLNLLHATGFRQVSIIHFPQNR